MADGVPVEVIDQRTVAPLDMETIVESVAKTGRLLIADECFALYGMRCRNFRTDRRSARSTIWMRQSGRLKWSAHADAVQSDARSGGGGPDDGELVDVYP